MRRLLRLLGIAAYWLGWPVYVIYFKLSARTRLLIVCHDEVLVMSNWLSDGRWHLPGGGLHRGEDPVKGVLREAFEELAVHIPPEAVRLSGYYDYRRHGHAYAYYQFIAEVPERFTFRRQWYEVADARWIAMRELNAATAGHEVLVALADWQSLRHKA